jgi:hypothetical protein
MEPILTVVRDGEWECLSPFIASSFSRARDADAER